MPNLRLKAFRAGQQWVGYLTLFTALSGQNRAAVGAAIRSGTGLRSTFEKESERDAGTLDYGTDANRPLESLRLRLGAWLDQQAPATRDRWHDPRPRRHDPKAVREIHPLPQPQ